MIYHIVKELHTSPEPGAQGMTQPCPLSLRADCIAESGSRNAS
jgi:hypothetical protein